MKFEQAKIRKSSPLLEKKLGVSNIESSINVFNEQKKGEYYLLPIEQLIPFKHQARIFFSEEKLKELSLTLKTHGIRQPLTVIKSKDFPEKFEVVSGERRFRAAKLAEFTKIPCIILENKGSAEEIAIIENIQREDLHPIELGNAYKHLYENGIFGTQKEIAIKLGVPRSQISEYMTFAELKKEEQDLIVNSHISDRKTLRKISSITDAQKRNQYLQDLIKKQSLPLSKEKKTIKRTRLISIYSESGNVTIKTASLKKLSMEERESLKGKIKELMVQIS